MRNKIIKLLSFVFVAVVLVSVVCFAGCDGCNKKVKVDEFTLNCESKEINVGESFSLSINESKYEGQVQFSSEDQAIAIVTSKGLVTGVSKGSTRICASLSDYSVYCTVTVNEVEQSGLSSFNVTLNKNAVRLKKDNRATITATVYDGKSLTENEVTWSVSDQSKMHIDVDEQNKNKVIITAKDYGQATLSATYGEFVANCTVTIEHNVDFVFSSDQGNESSKISKNEIKNIKPTIYVDDQIVSDAELSYESSNTNVVTVDANGNATGVGFGRATVDIIYGEHVFEYEIEVFDRIISTGIEKLTYKSDGESEYTFEITTQETSGLEYPLVLEDVTSMFIQGTDTVYNVSVSGNTITIDDLPVGENDYYLYNGNTKYEIKLLVASMIIFDYEDLIDLKNRISENANKEEYKHVLSDEYVCLANDIDCEGATYTTTASGNFFGGVLDGRGYEIKNIVLDKGGLFWGLSGTVKNIGLSFNANVNSSFGAIATELRVNSETEVAGKITDLFIEGKIVGESGGNVGGVVSKTYSGTRLQNIFANITFDLGSANNKGVMCAISQGTMTNCYAVSNYQSLSATGGTNTSNVKTSYGEFIASDIILNNYGECWDTTNKVPLLVNYTKNVPNIEIMNTEEDVYQSFYVLSNHERVLYSIVDDTPGVNIDYNGKVTFTSEEEFSFTVKVVSLCDDTKYATKEFSYAGGTFVNMTEQGSIKSINKNDNTDATLDISGFSEYDEAMTVTSIKANDTEITPITYANGVITFTADAIQTMPVGDVIITVYTDVKTTYQFVINIYNEVVITTKTQFVELFEELYQSSSNEANPLYIRLGADIEFIDSDSPLIRQGSFNFYGVIDGQGHAIKNLKIDTKTVGTGSAGGLLGNCYGDVFDVALVNVTVDNGTRGNAFGVICSTLGAGATISNVFISGNTYVSGYNVGGIVWTNNGTVENCIVALETTSNNEKIDGYSTLTCRAGTNAKNCYGISSTYKRNISTNPFSANVSEFFAEVSALPSNDGWGDVWLLENNTLTFGNNVVLSISNS